MSNYLYLIWKDPRTRRNFTVGKLMRGDKFTFEYEQEEREAKEYGWSGMEAFPDNRIYESEYMFPVFTSRLPDRKRRDISKILEKYNLSIYDEFELLRRSGARLPIDTYEFVDPISSEDKTIEREFFVMGIRHYTACDGTNCELLPTVEIGERLELRPEPENLYDPMAIRVLTERGQHLGYIPRYYSYAILERIKKNVSYSCVVIEVEPARGCSECVKVKFNMPSVVEETYNS